MPNMKVTLVLLISLVGAFAAPSNRITNGEDAKEGQFPYQISLQWGMFGMFQHVCGGSIIAPGWVLTAGHCITELPFRGDMRVRAGITKLNQKDYQEIDVVERIVHPNYEGGVNPNDIALLRLKEDLEYNDNVKAINLPVAGATPTGDSVLSGWGSTSTGILPSMPNHLQTAVLPLLSYEDCKEAFIALTGTSNPLDEKSNVCTGPLTGGLSACSGDSGGPLAQGETICGVVSWGMMPCGSKGAPSVYTKVSSYIDFIKENMH